MDDRSPVLDLPEGGRVAYRLAVRDRSPLTRRATLVITHGST